MKVVIHKAESDTVKFIDLWPGSLFLYNLTENGRVSKDLKGQPDDRNVIKVPHDAIQDAPSLMVKLDSQHAALATAGEAPKPLRFPSTTGVYLPKRITVEY